MAILGYEQTGCSPPAPAPMCTALALAMGDVVPALNVVLLSCLPAGLAIVRSQAAPDQRDGRGGGCR
eukprot:1161486-Pelagomonas_calceolata.AAC.3